MVPRINIYTTRGDDSGTRDLIELHFELEERLREYFHNIELFVKETRIKYEILTQSLDYLENKVLDTESREIFGTLSLLTANIANIRERLEQISNSSERDIWLIRKHIEYYTHNIINIERHLVYVDCQIAGCKKWIRIIMIGLLFTLLMKMIPIIV